MSNRDRRTRESRVWRRSFIVAVVLHVVLVLFWTSDPLPESPFAAEGLREADARAAEGSMQAVSMRPSVPDPIVPPQVPVPEVDVVEPPEPDEDPELDLSELEELLVGQADSEGQDDVGDELPGREGGEGRGDAGVGGEGLRRMIPPSPRGLIMPPSNQDLRGTEVEVWVFVDQAGQVVADSTRLNPPTRDRRFNERIQSEAAEWVFEPARRDGEPIAAWFPYKITM